MSPGEHRCSLVALRGALLAVGLGSLSCAPGRVEPAPGKPVASTALPAPVVSCEQAAGALTLLGHSIDVSLSSEPLLIRGQGEVRVRAERSTSSISLAARRLAVEAVTLDEQPRAFSTDGERLCVSLPATLAAGSEVALRITWAVPTEHESPHATPGLVWAAYAASSWMPTLQDPAQRATLALKITAPSAWKVAAVGHHVASFAAGDGRTAHEFRLDRPAPPFLYAFAAGQLAEAALPVDGVTLRALGPEGADLAGVLAITAPMLRFFQAQLGAVYPEVQYTQVFVPGSVAQEAAGLSLLGAESIDEVRRDPSEDWIFSHELAHQWFAWLVPCADFSDFWLNEGFATFLVAAYKEQRWGRPAYEREVALWRTRSAKVQAAGRDAPVALSAPGAPPRPPPGEAELQPRGVTYARGALVLHRLRETLGDAVFWRGLRGYVQAQSGKPTRTEHLRQAFEAASGQDLEGFFATWVYASAPGL